MSVVNSASTVEPVDPRPPGDPPDRPRSARAPLFIVLFAVIIVLAIGSFAYLAIGPGHPSRHCSEVQVGTGRC